jgi:hypothetical protein
MAQGLDIKAFTDGVVKSWWQWVLVALIAASGSIGVIGALWGLVKTVRKFLRVRLLEGST